MARSLLICGLVAGVLAGLLAFGFATIAGEPAIDQAIAYEDARTPGPAAGEKAEPELVSRTTQKGVGLLTASVVYGLALGGIFALVFAVAYGRVGRLSPAHTALLLAAAAFVVIYLVPFVKYPPNPPAVGDPDTIGRRTLLYLSMIWISVCAAVAGWRLRGALAQKRPGDVATVAGVLLYVVVVALAGLALPGVHEIPADFPATTLWRFREASAGTQLVTWAAIGLVFAPLAQRVMSGRPLPSPVPRRRRPVAAEHEGAP
jgi:predicted cobalt transporter CbtA